MTLQNTRRAALAALAVVGAMLLAASQASAFTITTTFSNWKVTGSLTPKKLNEPVTLPEGSTFNGTAEIFLGKPTTGTMTGTVFVPPFKAPVKLLGLVPTTVGTTFTQVGPANGTILSDPETADCAGQAGAGCLTVKVLTKANLGFTSAGVEGLSVPTQCVTAEPVSFELVEHQTLSELILTGPHFAGTTTIPEIKCEGLEFALGLVYTQLLSGPENPYQLSIAPALS